MSKQSGLTASIYTDNQYRGTREATAPGKHSGCCTAFGIVGEVTLVGDGFPELFEESDTAPAAILVRRMIGGKPVVHIEPLNPPPGFSGRPMAGGAFVETSDSRFGRAVGFYGAVSLHDRYER